MRAEKFKTPAVSYPANGKMLHARHLLQRRAGHTVLAYIFDLAVTAAALLLADVFLRMQGLIGSQPLMMMGGLVFAVWTFAFLLMAVYAQTSSRSFLDEMRRVLSAMTLAALILLSTLYIIDLTVAQVYLLTFFGLNAAVLTGWRAAARISTLVTPVVRTPVQQRVLIVGANELGRQVADIIRNTPWSGVQVFGFVDDERRGRHGEYPVVGALSDIQTLIEEYGIEEVVLALPHQQHEQLNRIVIELQNLPVQLRVVPSYLSLALYRPSIGSLGGMPLINLSEPALNRRQRTIKRAFDLMAAAILLIASLPIMALIAIMIRMDSPGPVLFKQNRIGENGRIFPIFKFRTMRLNADTLPQHGRILVDNIHVRRSDPRITRIGTFLRKSGLDELPQFINVLRGDMSLVGPRPEVPWLVEETYEAWQHQRFAVPQGITGWWQVKGRSEKPMHMNTDQDLYYIQNYSFWLDLKILALTLPAMIRGRGDP